jgi:hydroxymethylpyrimidine pyrophosphatase-like HAD family hydrolase
LLFVIPLAYMLYKSKIKVLQNIKLPTITATPKPQTFQFHIGKNQKRESGIKFTIESGKPIFGNKDIHKQLPYATTPNIFSSNTLLSHIPIIKHFELNRRETHTICDITVDDPGNPHLSNGPVVEYFPISKLEGFKITHRDPTLKDLVQKNSKDAKNTKNEDENSTDYVNIRGISPKISDFLDGSTHQSTSITPLPSVNDPNKRDEYYLKITRSFV